MNKFFGLPYYISDIDENKFNKEFIIKTITKNYEIDNFRNETHPFSLLHHEYEGENSKKFFKVDYSQLIPLYTEEIQKFFVSFNFTKPWKFEFFITNYTCINKIGQNMQLHLHPDCDFVAMHYLSFDHLIHNATLYRNPLTLGQLNAFKYENILKCYDTSENKNNDWLSPNFMLKVKENNFVITPSIVEHSIPVSKNNNEKLRIVVACNINFYYVDL